MTLKIDNLSNPQLVTIAVALLDGDSIYVDQEDIAIKVDEFAHERFNWRKYPEHIDMLVVVDALQDAKKSKNGALVIGGRTQGWMLSPRGISFIKSNDLDLNQFQTEKSVSPRKKSVAAKQEVECARLRNTKAYNLFIEGKVEEISEQDFYQFARINEYFKGKARLMRYTIIENAVSDDEKLTALWNFLKTQFKED